VGIHLGQRRAVPDRLVGAFAPDDLAVIHIDATGLHPTAFASLQRRRAPGTLVVEIAASRKSRGALVARHSA